MFAGVWVLGGVEIDTNERRMIAVNVENDRSRNSLLPLIEYYIAPGTEIWSDFRKAYDRLEKLIVCEPPMQHATVNHSKEFKSADGVHTNHIEGMHIICPYSCCLVIRSSGLNSSLIVYSVRFFFAVIYSSRFLFIEIFVPPFNFS